MRGGYTESGFPGDTFYIAILYITSRNNWNVGAALSFK